MLEIEADDFGVQGERRIVEHDAPFGVLRQILIVSAGEERPYDLLVSQGDDLLIDELPDKLKDFRRGVAVVRRQGQILIELSRKLIVPFPALASFSGKGLFRVPLFPCRHAPGDKREVVP